MKRFTRLFLFLGLVSAAFAASAKFPQITHDELVAAVQSKSATVIDVNGTESFSEGRVPGAIDYSAHEDNLAAVLPKDKNALIVAYCGNPKCGAYKEAAQAAAKLGYTNVKYYSGGIDGWRASGAPLDKN